MKALGVEISRNHVRAGIVVAGQSRAHTIRQVEYRVDRNGLGGPRTSEQRTPRISAMFKVVSELLDVAPDVYAIGIAAPGVVDPESGMTLDDPDPTYNDTNWLRHISTRFGGKYAVYVQNDAKASAWGEYLFWRSDWMRESKRHKPRPASLVHIIVDEGIGSGVILDGKILPGAHLVAGEFGTLPYSNQIYGNVKIEDLAARQGIQRLTSTKSISELIRRSGETQIREGIDQAAQVLGTGIAALINILGPEVITLGGKLIEEIPEYFELTSRYAEDAAERVALADGLFRRATLGLDAAIVGIAHLALQHR